MSDTPIALPVSTRIVAGRHGLTELHVQNALASAVLTLQGAQLLSFQPHGQPDWLFLSPRAVFKTGQAIRGGVPVCWPWFGPDPTGQGRPAHGFARQSLWALRHALDEADGSTRLLLELSDSEATLALWPHRFTLRLELRIGATLGLALTTLNVGDTALELTQALHSYFAVDDVTDAQVMGLEGCSFIDQVPGAPREGPAAPTPLRFVGRTDRIYRNVPPLLRLRGARGGHGLALSSEGSRTAVVWNPGAEVAAGMADLGDGAHTGFVCVETANAGDEVLTLAPGEQHRLAVEISAFRSSL